MQNVRVRRLACEYGINPLGIDTKTPRLSWIIESYLRGIMQYAYRIIVASTEAKLEDMEGDVWDSGKVESDSSIQIPFGGNELKSFARYYWKVAVWVHDETAPFWSESASWTMGILDPRDWHASWITSRDQKKNQETLLLRRDFFVKQGLRRALAYVCGLGHYEISLNGSNASDALFPPAWTKYDKTCLYDTYDITHMVKENSNAVGLFLGNGFYNLNRIPYYMPGWTRYAKSSGSFGPLKAIAQLYLEYEDGSTEIVGTDSTWTADQGPITFSCMFGGEDYDARLEQKGWNEPRFDENGWEAALVVDGPGGTLRGYCSSAPPIRTFETIQPIGVTHLNATVSMYDMGQNVSLMPKIKVRGPSGSVVRIMPSELLGQDGFVDRRSCTHGGGPAYWQYTLSGNGEEVWFPKFFYHGSRYLQVECIASPQDATLPSVEELEALVVHSASRQVGEFECSSDLFNRIHTLIRWAQRSNLMHVITDCPHRERMGWLEQYHLHGPSLRYEHDMAQLYAKCMIDMADSQLENGLVPDTAPEYTVFRDGFRDSPEWGSAYIIVPWQQYEWTGDTALLRTHYDGMKRYLAYLTTRSENYIVSHGLGDWFDIGPNPPDVAQLTPIALTATAFYYLDAKILHATATLLGLHQDAEYFETLAHKIREAFNRTFFNRTTRQYATGSQCANAIALVMGLVEPEYRIAVLEALVHDVREHGNANTAGDIGYRYVLRALADGGRSDVIFDMNNQSDTPGYGYQLQKGATSLTEAWGADPDRSQNHFMLGQIMEWFYHDLAGISCDGSGPGFKRIVIKPQIIGDITYAKAEFDSIHGKIASSWERSERVLHMHIKIPANTSATIFVPASEDTIKEGGKDLKSLDYVTDVRYVQGVIVFEVASGVYEFEAVMK